MVELVLLIFGVLSMGALFGVLYTLFTGRTDIRFDPGIERDEIEDALSGEVEEE